MEKKQIRIGLIGTGFMGKTHAEAYREIENAMLVAVSGSQKLITEDSADFSGISVYSDYKVMIQKEELDAVDICLPTPLHAESIVNGLITGLDVIVEKPITKNLKDLSNIAEAIQKSKKRIMIAHVCRFMSEYMFCKKIIDSGELGKPLFFGAWRESETPSWSSNNWIPDKSQSGGTIMDLSIHDIDLANWFLGEPQACKAYEVKQSGDYGLSHVVSTIKYPSGAFASIEASHLMPRGYPFSTGFRLLLENGVIESIAGTHSEKYMEVFSDSSTKRIYFSELYHYKKDDPYIKELSHFVNNLISGEKFRISFREAQLAVETALKLIDSIDT